MRDGQAGLGHPPMAGWGGWPRCQGGLKGSERPEAGCLGELTMPVHICVLYEIDIAPSQPAITNAAHSVRLYSESIFDWQGAV